MAFLRIKIPGLTEQEAKGLVTDISLAVEQIAEDAGYELGNTEGVQITVEED